MNNRSWIVLFCFILALNIAGIYLPGSVLLEKITKPLLMIILAGWFIFSTKRISSSLKKWVIAAIAFSWLGDVLLMFQSKGSIFFLLGLSAFLTAHIFYIIFFHVIKKEQGVKSKSILLAPVVVYYAVLISILYPVLADMKAPVLVYGLVISFMLLLALHMLFIKDKDAGKYMVLGAVLFVVSDSVLAFNKFYQPFEAAGFIVMLTYGLAQLFIVKGAIRYICSAKI